MDLSALIARLSFHPLYRNAGQFATFNFAPVNALNKVVFPQFGFPTKQTLIGLSVPLMMPPPL